MLEGAQQMLVKAALKSLLALAASHEEDALSQLRYVLTTTDLPLPDAIEKPLDELIEAAAKEAYDMALAALSAVVDPPAPAGPPAP